jgi:hypothetical protein
MIGGRSAWLAWPVGVVCVGVVGALVWLAAPGVPMAVQFAGDVLRSGTEQLARPQAAPQPIESIGTARDDDCRTLYPDSLWMELTWNPDTVLSQSRDLPATSAESVRDALSPDVLMTCAWRADDGGSVTTTLSRVDAAAAAIARDAFTGAGFDCTNDALVGAQCTKTTGDTIEDNIVVGRMWLSTIERSWHPDRYTDRLVHRLWPE